MLKKIEQELIGLCHFKKLVILRGGPVKKNHHVLYRKVYIHPYTVKILCTVQVTRSRECFSGSRSARNFDLFLDFTIHL